MVGVKSGGCQCFATQPPVRRSLRKKQNGRVEWNIKVKVVMAQVG